MRLRTSPKTWHTTRAHRNIVSLSGPRLLLLVFEPRGFQIDFVVNQIEVSVNVRVAVLIELLSNWEKGKSMVFDFLGNWNIANFVHAFDIAWSLENLGLFLVGVRLKF